MPEFRKKFEEAWAQALVSVNAAEQEAEKVMARVAEAAGFSHDDVRRHAREFGERLRAQRSEIERTLDDAVRRFTSHLRLVPSSGELAELRKRVEEVAARLDSLERQRRAGAGADDRHQAP
jgi:hypothetical protein